MKEFQNTREHIRSTQMWNNPLPSQSIQRSQASEGTARYAGNGIARKISAVERITDQCEREENIVHIL